jgi:hypothetical protein
MATFVTDGGLRLGRQARLKVNHTGRAPCSSIGLDGFLEEISAFGGRRLMRSRIRWRLQRKVCVSGRHIRGRGATRDRPYVFPNIRARRSVVALPCPSARKNGLPPNCWNLQASKSQLSNKGAPYQNGYFTHFLLEALRQNNGMNTIQEDFDYAKDQLPKVVPARAVLAWDALEGRFPCSHISIGNASPRPKQQRVGRGDHFGRSGRDAVKLGRLSAASAR